jgi:ATP-dependent exoDNAse (exonuclease V) beta subunit
MHAESPPDFDATTGSSLEAGVLVHRALARGTDDIAALVRDDERAAVRDVDALIAHARDALSAIRRHPDVVEIFGDLADVAWRRHEVPFSFQSRGSEVVVRGTIDCLAQLESGVIQVLEFKTGAPLSRHREQLELYVEAARALFPGRTVEGKLIYGRREQLSGVPGV